MKVPARVRPSPRVAACTIVLVTATGCGGGNEEPPVAGPPPCAGSSTTCVTVAGVDGLPPADAVAERTGSWAPAPSSLGGLRAVASVDDDGRLLLHTVGGDRTFLTGVNLGATEPGRQPGEIDGLGAQHYRRWLDVAGRAGARVVRVYTIHPPAFYDELAAYNARHPDAPLYLVQGVYFLDEARFAATGDLDDPELTSGFLGELDDAHLAVQGLLRRPEPLPGRATGTWTTDVTPWLAAWIVGIELAPEPTLRNDDRHAGRRPDAGTYFRATPDASPTEQWLASALDHLASLEARDGRSVPIAFVGWPTVDPLVHPDEPLATEDLVGVDANHVLPTAAWPGGSFASYHAYPYYPDFQRHEPGLQATGDPYRGYVRALRAHHAVAGLPVVISEVGVPSSVGSAHAGPLGRDQGGHSEAEAMRIDGDLVEVIADEGLGGAFLFALHDEWFKFTWNTIDLQIPGERRALWSDALTNEQAFGLIAAHASQFGDLVLGDGREWPTDLAPVVSAAGEPAVIQAATDEGHVYLRIAGAAPTHVAFDVDPELGAGGLPGTDGAVPDADVVVDVGDEELRLSVMTARDHVTVLYGQGRGYVPVDAEALANHARSWTPFRLITNRPLTVPSTGQQLPVELLDVSRLIRGTTDPGTPTFDARAMWWRDGDVLAVRVPWAMLGVADPSSRTILDLRDGEPAGRQVDGIGITVRLDDGHLVTAQLRWEPWQRVEWTERVKDGVDQLAERLLRVLERSAGR